MSEKPRLELKLDPNIDVSKPHAPPNLTGTYKLAGSEVVMKLSLWARLDKNEHLAANGDVEASSIKQALQAGKTGELNNVQVPPGLKDFTSGKAVLFEDPDANAQNQKPTHYGYVHDPIHGIVKLSGWESGTRITGKAEPYRPGQSQEASGPARDPG